MKNKSSSSNSKGNKRSSSLDLDKTLPLPPDIEAELMESQRTNSNSNNNHLAATTTTVSEQLLIQLNAWTTPTAERSQIITESDVAALLSFASKLQSGQLEWNAVNYNVAIAIVRLVMMATTGSSSGSNLMNLNDGAAAATAATSQHCFCAALAMEDKFARRILTDGILPFAAVSTSATASSKGNEQGEDKVSFWNAKLIQSIVTQHLLPSVLVVSRSNYSSTSTMAVEIMLDHFLARMDANEEILSRLGDSTDDYQSSLSIGQNYEGDNSINKTNGNIGQIDTFAADTVDTILDILCNVIPSSPPSLSSTTITATTTTAKLKVHRNATAAVINSLRDLESSVPGRLSRRRVWRKSCTTTAAAAGGVASAIHIQSSRNSNNMGMKEYHYEFIDRPTHLIQMAISALVASHEQCDYDSLPPLVYQLGLIPMSVFRRGSSNNISGDGGDWNCVKSNSEKKLESEKQRGIRLRRMCLEGIALVLDDDDDDDNAKKKKNVVEESTASPLPRNNCGMLSKSSSKDLFSAKDDDFHHPQKMKKITVQQQQQLEEAWRWARYNSISFVGTCSRSDPEMSKAVLSLLGGEIIMAITPSSCSSTTAGVTNTRNVAPFRYQRLTPFKLAMGLSLAKSVPRIRIQVLETIRDLVMEEEMIRIKCGRGVSGDVIELGHPWMDCLVKSVMMTSSSVNKNDRMKILSLTEEKHSNGFGQVLSNIISVAKFAVDTESSGSTMGGLDLLQSLIDLGFLLVDCVKRDEPTSRCITNAVSSSCLLSPAMEISSFGRVNKVSTADTSAAHATASVGRFVLCCLFYQSAASSSHYLSSSLITSHGSSSSDGGTSLCRTLLKTSFDKFSSMSPNSVEHALLLTDLLNFSPEPLQHIFMDEATVHDGLMDKQREEIIGLSLATSHLRDIIETLSNLIGGGMNGRVACDVISPAVGKILLVQATHRQGLGSLWKKTDIEDHVDHAFLLAKKALFSADVEKRKAAANLLVALLGAASVASTLLGRANTWASVLYEIKGCLRRCLTQHQPSVRMEAYSALVALLPKAAISMEATQTQDSVSPISNATPASTVSPLALSRDGGMSGMVIPPIGQNALIRVVSDVLLSALERYVTTPQEELHEKDARLKRAAHGVGLSQMETEAEDCKDQSMPLRFENIISNVPLVQAKSGTKKSVPIGQLLFNEAMSRINEPLSFLVASCSAAASLSTDDKTQNELKKAIIQLRRRMAACSDIDEYLLWLKANNPIFDIKNNSKRIEEMAICKISTLVCVAVLAEAMLSACEWGKDDLLESEDDIESFNQEVENLFNLRVDAIDKAAEIMSSFVSQKSQKASRKAKTTKQVDENSQNESKGSKKINKKSEKSEENNTLSMAKTSEINATTLARNKKLIEEAVYDLSPSMSKDFLSRSLKHFGASASKHGEFKTIFDGDESGDAASRLYGCIEFRRFLLIKCMLLTSGSSLIVSPGVRFCSLDEPKLDEKLVQFRLASCFSLGPILFSEFCAHCYHLDRTSAKPNHSSSDLSLAQLSLRSFNYCVRGMNFYSPGHPLSRAKRVGALLSMSMRMASVVAPASKEGWDFYFALKSDSVKIKDVDVPDDALDLKKSLLPFVSFCSTFKFPEDNEAPARFCLFSELVLNAMYGEAFECSQLISAAASAFSEPNMREQLGCEFLRAWEVVKDSCIGVLGIDFTDVKTDEVLPLSTVVGITFQLSHQLDGETHVPLLDSRTARSAMGLPLTVVENWPKKHQERLRRETKNSGGCSIIGIVQQLVLSLHGALGTSENFIEEVESELTTKQVKLALAKAVLNMTDESSKERMALGSNISLSIEAGLDNADFVVLKLIPHMHLTSLTLAQRFVASMLLSTSKVISTSAPFAENMDCNATFSSSLLRSTKRLYSILVKLILSYMSNPESLVSKETKFFLDYIKSTFMPRISSLLLALSKQTTTKDGKYIAESKIESHGKISALLVFEKEKLDNVLLKVGAKLKLAGLEEESAWLEEQVVAVHSRDFEIKTDQVENAMAMEAPKEKKANGAKRKAKSEPSKNAKRKKKRKAETQEEECEEEVNDSDAVAEVVEGESDEEGDSNDDEEDIIDEEESEDGISLDNLTEEICSESEEAEFSD